MHIQIWRDILVLNGFADKYVRQKTDLLTMNMILTLIFELMFLPLGSHYHSVHEFTLWCLWQSVKSVYIRSYSGPHFPHLDWIRIDTQYLSIFSPNARKCGPEQLRIRTFFTLCELTILAKKVYVWQGLDYPSTLRYWLLESRIKEHNKRKVDLQSVLT